MNDQQAEWTWLDDSETVTVAELSQVCGMTTAEVDELVEYGAILPLQIKRQERLFSAQCITQLRTAGRLKMDFDLDLFAVAVLLGYLNRIEALERQVRMLQAHAPSHAVTGMLAGPYARADHPG